jgi:hypothetical protein
VVEDAGEFMRDMRFEDIEVVKAGLHDLDNAVLRSVGEGSMELTDVGVARVVGFLEVGLWLTERDRSGTEQKVVDEVVGPREELR